MKKKQSHFKINKYLTITLLIIWIIGMGWLLALWLKRPEINEAKKLPIVPSKSLPESPVSLPPTTNNNFYVAVEVVNIYREASANSERVSQALLGEPVMVISRQGSWVEVRLPDQFDYRGWLQDSALQAIPVKDWLNLQIVAVPSAEVWTLPKSNASLVEVLSLGMVVASEVLKEDKNFTLVKLVNGRKGYVLSKNLLPYSQNNAAGVSSDRILETARQLLGQPYLWGGMTTKGVDCSGFVHTVFKVHSIHLHRDADLQYFYDGISVKPEDLQPGDLVFFETYKSGPSHIGIYVGDRKFIQAASGGVNYGTLDSDYFSHHFLGAKRILSSN